MFSGQLPSVEQFASRIHMSRSIIHEDPIVPNIDGEYFGTSPIVPNLHIYIYMIIQTWRRAIPSAGTDDLLTEALYSRQIQARHRDCYLEVHGI